MARTICWFSCGAASAVATKLTITHEPAEIVYTNPGSEHPDNQRFLNDCQTWFGQPITIIKSDKYVDTWQVWEQTRYLVGPAGARCTAELKRKPRFQFQQADDIQVFGYTIEEQHRAERFRQQNPEVTLVTPLIERGLTKADCLAMLERAGIQLPAMYLLGYNNNNCVGCPKGGIGYWNKIRVDFPEVFERMAQLERRLGASCLRNAGGSLWLDELDPQRGSHEEPDFECSLLCAMAEQEFEPQHSRDESATVEDDI